MRLRYGQMRLRQRARSVKRQLCEIATNRVALIGVSMLRNV
ncbi:MAG: hypothetical protein WA105_02370 [Candidatus Hydromicrobium sp.]